MRKTKDKNVAEIAMTDLFEQTEQIEHRLKEIETITNDIWSKIMMCHSLLVVRKVSEDKLNDLKNILD